MSYQDFGNVNEREHVSDAPFATVPPVDVAIALGAAYKRISKLESRAEFSNKREQVLTEANERQVDMINALRRQLKAERDGRKADCDSFTRNLPYMGAPADALRIEELTRELRDTVVSYGEMRKNAQAKDTKLYVLQQKYDAIIAAVKTW